MPRFLLFLLLCGFSQPLLAQKHTISGYLRDAQSGELLIGANAYVQDLKVGAVTNAYGFYSLTIPAGTHQITYSYIGYQPQTLEVKLQEDLTLEVELEPSMEMLREVVITDNKARDNVEAPKMSTIDVSVETIKEIPTIGGEKDVLKTIQLLPGVQSGGEGSSGFYVRGGGPDQNLILLDEAVVYNPFHLFGFFSIFNPDALRNITLVKGGFPAQYGGRLSSILDMSLKDGNMREFHGEGGIGLIASRLTLEGPIVEDKASFMVSGRRTYADLLVRPFLPKGTDAAYYFFDLNGKVNYKFSEKDRIYISGYHGKDLFFFKENFDDESLRFQVDWGNNTGTLRWNHLFNSKLFSNTSLIYNDYGFKVSSGIDSIEVGLFSGIRDWTLKTDFDYYPSPKQHIKFGGSYTYHRFTPQALRGSKEILQRDLGIDLPEDQVRKVHEMALYVNDEIRFSDRFAVALGLRVPVFQYESTTYWSAEPRVTANYQLNENSSIKGGYTLMNQYLHMVSSSTVSVPLDLWVPSTDVVKPQLAQQVAMGYFRNFHNNAYEASVEGYYKDMRNQIEYEEGANVFFNENIDEELVFGCGWSYGAEFLFRKREGRLNGWVGYTLSWSMREFEELNFGNPFPAKFDRRHDLAVATFYDFNEHWSFSTVFVYGSGHHYTFPAGYYQMPSHDNPLSSFYGQYNDYEGRNNVRLPAYHRLDLGISYTKENRKFTSIWRFDIYNLYSRRNAYFIYPTQEFDPQRNLTRTVGRQVSLFPMIPSFSYNFKF